MTDPKPATVEVPVELLERLIARFGFDDQGAQIEARALLPKPKPRLVAVNVEDLPVGGGVTHWNAWAHNLRDDAPDLLPLLDEAVDEVMNVTDWPRVRDGLKARIRTALGVDQ